MPRSVIPGVLIVLPAGMREESVNYTVRSTREKKKDSRKKQ